MAWCSNFIVAVISLHSDCLCFFSVANILEITFAYKIKVQLIPSHLRYVVQTQNGFDTEQLVSWLDGTSRASKRPKRVDMW